MRKDLENPMVSGVSYYRIGGTVYQQMKIYCSCDYCGRPIYEGDTFHLIGRDKYHCDKVCEACHEKKVAGE